MARNNAETVALSDKFPTLDSVFEEQLEITVNIENSSLASDDIQRKMLSAISKLEELTISVSYLGVFSSNETVEELSTKSIKFLMLPVLLASLTLKLLGKPREEILKISLVYFKDFIRRCKQYNLTLCEEPEESDEETPEVSNTQAPVVKSSFNMTTPEDLRRLAKQREEKIARYKEKKALAGKLAELKKSLENPSQDESVAREYYLTMIRHFLYVSLEERDSIKMELNMLQQMKRLNVKGDGKNYSFDVEEKSKSFRPFLITKDAIQKKVFGAGYPSLPVLSVEEFYEQRVKEGWFPPSADHSRALSKAKRADENVPDNNGSEEEIEDKDRERLRDRDEWRDTHRTGWGNTYNRS